MRFISQSFVIFASLFLAFVWHLTSLSNYTVPAIGVLIVLYLLAFIKKGNAAKPNSQTKESFGVFILITAILLLIFTTNSISSTFFFLIYFLSFGIAFIFEPAVIFSFTIGIMLIFLPDAVRNDLLGNFMRLGSLLLISPLAFFFGREYRKREAQDEDIEAFGERTKEAADTISKDVEKVLKDEKQILKHHDIEKLNEILEETEDLRQEMR